MAIRRENDYKRVHHGPYHTVATNMHGKYKHKSPLCAAYNKTYLHVWLHALGTSLFREVSMSQDVFGLAGRIRCVRFLSH